MAAIKFSSFGGYRRFCKPWWKDLWRTVTTGWIYDVSAYWHRARHGWADRDTWSLDDYLYRVMAGSIRHLADNAHGSPGTYPYHTAMIRDAAGTLRPLRDDDDYNQIICDHAQWRDDLYRWAKAFEDVTRHDYHAIHGRNYDAWHADERNRQAMALGALEEMLPWWEALWN